MCNFEFFFNKIERHEPGLTHGILGRRTFNKNTAVQILPPPPLLLLPRLRVIKTVS